MPFCLVSATRRRALLATLSIIVAVLIVAGAILWKRRRRHINEDTESNINVYQARLNKLYCILIKGCI